MFLCAGHSAPTIQTASTRIRAMAKYEIDPNRSHMWNVWRKMDYEHERKVELQRDGLSSAPIDAVIARECRLVEALCLRNIGFKKLERSCEASWIRWVSFWLTRA